MSRAPLSRWIVPSLLCFAWVGAAERVDVAAIVAGEDRMMMEQRATGVWERLYHARRENGCRLPLPRAVQPPRIDGKLDDPCWKTATSVFETADYLGSASADTPRRHRYCAADDHLYLGLDMVARRSPGGNSTIELRVGKRHGRVEFNDKRARYHGPASPRGSPWEESCRFVGDATRGSFEIAIPLRKLFGEVDWRKEGLALRWRFRRFAGSLLAGSGWIELFPAPFALRLEAPPQHAGAEQVFAVTLTAAAPPAGKLRAEVLLVRESEPRKPERLAEAACEPKQGRPYQVDVKYRLTYQEGAGLVLLVLRGQGWESRCVSYLAAPRLAPLLTQIEKLLNRADHPQRKQWGAQWRALSATHAKLKAAKGAAGRNALWELYSRARRLKREVFLGRLPADLDDILFIKRHPYTAGGRWFTTHYHFEPGGNALCVYSIRKGTLRTILRAPDHTAIRDPDLHYDGRRIAFAARSRKPDIFPGLKDGPRDTWSIYEVNTDGTGIKRLTKDKVYDLEPVYLPDGRILFGSLRSSCWGCCTGHSAYNFHVMNGDGSGIRRFTANYLYDVAASVMHDGRIVFLRWVHEDKPGNHINALWTVRQDGTGLAGYFGMSAYGCTIEPRAIPGTTEVVCVDSELSGHWRLPQNGHLGIIDPAFGRTKFAHHIRSPLPFGAGWGFKTPYPLTRDLFLVSYGNLERGFGLYLVDREGDMEVLYRDAALSCYKPVPFRPRSGPPVTARPTAEVEAARPAVVTILNVYDGLPGIEPGTVKSIRVVQVPDKNIVNNGNSSFADQTIAVSYVYRMVRHVLGTAPVHEDGSAHLLVPPSKAVYFQLLDADGLMVQTMRDTTSFRPGERVSCIGCHEPQATAPPASARVAQALRHPPARLQPLESGARGVSFPRDIQPILDRRCVRCHDVTKPDGGVVLSGDVTRTFNIAYETLNHHNRDWGHSIHPRKTAAIAPVITYIADTLPPRSTGAHASPLFRKYLRADHYDVKPTKREIAALAAWVDLNLPYYTDWERKRYPGGRNIQLGRATQTLLGKVAAKRCAKCHHAKHRPLKLELGLMVNLSRPPLSRFLYYPLAAERGGRGKCGTAVFKDANDPDYQAILHALEKERAKIPFLSATSPPKPS